MEQSVKLGNKTKSNNREVKAEIDYQKLRTMIRKIVREELQKARYPLISSQEQKELENLYSKEALMETYNEEDYIGI